MTEEINKSDYLNEDGTVDYEKLGADILHYQCMLSLQNNVLGGMHDKEHQEKMISRYESIIHQLEALDVRKPVQIWECVGVNKKGLAVLVSNLGNVETEVFDHFFDFLTIQEREELLKECPIVEEEDVMESIKEEVGE